RWLVQCDCGQDATALAGDLVSGKTRSCGCLRKETAQDGRGFVKGMALVEHQRKESILVEGSKLYLAPRPACRMLRVAMSTLAEWAKKGCPWLDGAPLTTRQMPGAYRRVITFFAWSDLQRVRRRRLVARATKSRFSIPTGILNGFC